MVKHESPPVVGSAATDSVDKALKTIEGMQKKLRTFPLQVCSDVQLFMLPLSSSHNRRNYQKDPSNETMKEDLLFIRAKFKVSCNRLGSNVRHESDQFSESEITKEW